MEVALSIFGLFVIGVITWWDWENPDKKYIASGTLDAESTRLNNERKSKQVSKLEKKVNKLNEENPGRLFYRIGPRVREYSPEEVTKINFTKSEYERLNAPYAPHQRHYFIIDGVLAYAGEERIKWYKFEEKTRKINRKNKKGIICKFDHINMKLINKLNGEEIPFDPDKYTLTGD